MSESPAANLARADQPIGIRAEVSLADGDTCKFTVSRSLHAGGSVLWVSREQAATAPLGERLFALDGVASVLVACNVVAVGAALRAQLLSGVPALGQTAGRGGAPSRSDAELGTAVQQLLDREVNRAIANHGGQISLVSVRERRLFITMSGGCQGCASSQVTLRQGFEVMVKRVAPEITAIVDATDHAAGKQPFYPRAGSTPGSSGARLLDAAARLPRE
ncbi:MAG: NifU family protein [Bacteriovorax sp.]|nr:NifU family protein [Rhizobacter sp.]